MLLNVHSYYSLRYGTLSLEALVENMQLNGYDTAVITDINNSTGVLDFIRKGREEGLNILAGMEYRNGNELLYIGIAKNEKGFKELNELMTDANRQHKPLPNHAPDFNHVFVIYPFGKKEVGSLKENEYIGIRHRDLNKIAFQTKADLERYIILHPVSFDFQDYKLHAQLRAIDHNILISQLKAEQMAESDEVFISRGELIERFKQFPQIIQNTNDLLGQCSFNFDFSELRNKKDFTHSRYEDKELLNKYALEGFIKRYGKNNKEAKERILKELDSIETQNFSSYFLITNDICQYARSKNFHYVGRGSGANSIVAYCLGITDVCPIELDLYFERFLNPKRKSSPDFDVDFCWNERDEIYSYIFEKYPHTALMGAMSTFRSRSILRELGKIYGLPKSEIDRLVHEPQHMLNKNEVTNMILSVYDQMGDFPNQRTIHASGILISQEALTNYSALDYPPKNLPTVQFNMHLAEAIGFEKFDILSQRGLGHIKDCREIVKQNRGEVIDTSNPRLFFNDPKITEKLRSADTIGCFYIESPAMRQLLSKLNCDSYLTLVAASSIIRPGVASSGMMRTYIERHHHPEKVSYLHPVFKEQLGETYGVMVYQEDVMKIGHHYGGLDLADADVLRRMMSGKSYDKDQMEAIQTKFINHCREQKYPDAISHEVWRQMESFAGYSFNKAHSASFAVESYQSLFLKTYYPLEFMVSVLNNYGGFYQRKVYVNEARKAGGTICLPCVNKSISNTCVDGTDVYLGFDCLRSLETKWAILIPKERLQNGEYTSLENFVLRTNIHLTQLILLIRCGSLRFTGIGKKELLWEAHFLLNGNNHEKSMPLLFESIASKPVLPKLETSILEDLYDEIELIGFPVTASLFDLAKSDFRGEALASNLKSFEGKVIRIVGDFIAEKTTRTKNGSYLKFGSFFDVNGVFFDTVHFPQSLKKYPLQGNGLYLIMGKIVLDFGYPSIEVQKCARMPMKEDPRSQ